MKKILTFLVFVMFFYGVRAQDTIKNTCYNAHYLTFDIGTGYQSLFYDLDKFGHRTSGIGFMSRVGYRWFFVPHWGVGVGLTYNNLRTFSKLNFTQQEGSDTVIFNNFKERQRTQVWKIPIGFYFQHELGRRWTFGAGLGVEYGLLADQSYVVKSGTFDIRSEKYNDVGEYFAGKTHLKNFLSTFGEINFMYALSHKVDLDLGIYGSYGLTDMEKNNDCNVFEVADKQYSGILNSKLADDVNNVSLGIMVGLRVRLSNGKQRQKQEDMPTAVEQNNVVENNNVDSIPEVIKPDNTEIVENSDTLPQNNDVPEVIENVVDNNDADTIKKIIEPLKEEKLPTQITFGLNSADNPGIVENGKSLDDIAKILKDNPNSKLKIVGHTCNLGTHEVNLRVGQRRADYVKKELLKRGVNSNQLITQTAAETSPIVPNTSEANRRKNRRVELWLIH